MKNFPKTVFWTTMIIGTQIVGVHIAGAQPESAAILARQQLSECMTKRMRSDRNLSYNDAMRACKERLQPPKDLASNNPVDKAAKGR